MTHTTRELVFATNNQHKLYEVGQILKNTYQLKSLNDLGFIDEIPEDFSTLHENALQKAWFVSNKFGVNCFADDTGLEVEALNGEPGVHSARYAGEERDPAQNIVKLLQELKGVASRKAQFRTIIALIWDGKEYLFEGTVTGQIIDEFRGHDGFGYDPIFLPDGYSQTFAEMELSLKNSISHRGKAIRLLTDFLLSNIG
ncbi:MAG TPA: non-canonical purine NTP diphosphatase [Tenuifilaceae bacterium]|nr:non-canonical purine NTP diphosphatase [Tenuifilaceae bacterium]HPE19288.1 non-canonical purine NTP diphosphatase [Tenuifilaceae bacterium]HPJ46756.1 non-canonical purine NTP diphosphatase [Tenuifilaceae bacterium]HPQ33874.1 non-canonical purine NTP diphosphatase [Tenuifilaceae bacterium]HRX68443.1 non-canonical purine NTP diphosphatase [Tenuifilaceae bacterium]